MNIRLPGIRAVRACAVRGASKVFPPAIEPSATTARSSSEGVARVGLAGGRSEVQGSGHWEGRPHLSSILACGFVLFAALGLFSGCMFDVSRARQQPVNFTARAASESAGFTLLKETKVSVGSGFLTHLKAGTRWKLVGTTPHGDVFTTKDQILTVEESNIFEAQLVVADSAATGFYLPVEKTFVAATRPVPLETKPLEANQP
jgi:hypothetical protein